MKELNMEERPYEKCERFGPENLTDSELLAVLLRTGTRGENIVELAKRILYSDQFQGGLLGIHRWSFEQLTRIKGIGKVKATQILCLCELAKRLSKASAGPELNFNIPSTIARYYMEDLRHQAGDHEAFAAEYQVQAHRRDGYFQGDRQHVGHFSKGIVCRGSAEGRCVNHPAP